MTRDALKVLIDAIVNPEEGADPSIITAKIDEVMAENDRLEAELKLAKSTADNYKSAYIRDFMGKESKEEVSETVGEEKEEGEKEEIKIEEILDL